jgi:hypothetical protein
MVAICCENLLKNESGVIFLDTGDFLSLCFRIECQFDIVFDDLSPKMGKKWIGTAIVQ